MLKQVDNKQNSFLMRVDDICELKGRGVVVTGVIQKGSVAQGDFVDFIASDETVFSTEVKGIEFNGRIEHLAVEGEAVGLLVRGEMKDIHIGDTIVR